MHDAEATSERKPGARTVGGLHHLARGLRLSGGLAGLLGPRGTGVPGVARPVAGTQLHGRSLLEAGLVDRFRVVVFPSSPAAPGGSASTTGIPTSVSRWSRAAHSTAGSRCSSTCPKSSPVRRAAITPRSELRRSLSPRAIYDVYEMTILRRHARRPRDGIMIVFTGRRMVELGFPVGRFTEG